MRNSRKYRGSLTIAAIMGVTALITAGNAAKLLDDANTLTLATTLTSTLALLIELPLLLYTRSKETQSASHREMIEELSTTIAAGPKFTEPAQCWVDLAAIDVTCGHHNEQTAELERLIQTGSIQRDPHVPNRYRWQDQDGHPVIMTVTRLNVMERLMAHLKGHTQGEMGHYALYTSIRATTRPPEGYEPRADQRAATAP